MSGNWRPLPQSGGGEPRRLGESLGRYRTPLAAVLEVWAGAVGDDIAAHAHPVAVRGGALVVEVNNPAWAGQLQWLGADLLARLHEAVGSPVAGRVEIRIKHP